MDELEMQNPNDELNEESSEEIKIKSKKAAFTLDVDSVQNLVDTVTFATKQLEKATKSIDIEKASTNFSKLENEMLEIKQAIKKSNIDSIDLAPFQNAVHELENVKILSKTVKKFKIKSFVFSIVIGLFLGGGATAALGYFAGVSTLAADKAFRQNNYVISKSKYKYIKTQKLRNGGKIAVFRVKN